MYTIGNLLFHSLTFVMQGVLVEIITTSILARLKGDKCWIGRISAKMIIGYALLLLVFIPVYNLVAYYPWMVRGLVYGIVGQMLEYGLGWFLFSTTGLYHWHYEGRFNIGHLVDLAYLPLFILGGLLFELNWLYVRLVFP